MKQIEVKNVVEALLRQPLIKVNTLESERIPNDKGVYIFVDSDNPFNVIYAGSATGTKGLHNRIVKQHLNPRYLETREYKQSKSKDHFQLKEGNYVLVNEKVAIDKSAFRKNVAREHELKVGKESLHFIENNFSLRFLSLSTFNSLEIKLIEKELIVFWRPSYNQTGKRKIPV